MARSDTPKRILATSLALFNAEGEPNVTTNEIALEMDISPGNLHYHFRRKDDIVMALLDAFEEDITPLLDGPGERRLAADEFWLYLHLLFETIGHYRFLFRNLPDLCDRLPILYRRLKRIFQRLGEVAQEVLGSLGKAGMLNATAIEQAALIENLRLTMLFWLPYHARFVDVDSHEDQWNPADDIHPNSDPLASATAQILLMVAPYLDSDSRQEILELAAAYQG